MSYHHLLECTRDPAQPTSPSRVFPSISFRHRTGEAYVSRTDPMIQNSMDV